jgi:hypothetical protein
LQINVFWLFSLYLCFHLLYSFWIGSYFISWVDIVLSSILIQSNVTKFTIGSKFEPWNLLFELVVGFYDSFISMHSNDFERVWLWLYRCPYYFPFLPLFDAIDAFLVEDDLKIVTN